MGNHNIEPLIEQSQDNFIYCEICEIRHINSAWCQASQQDYDQWMGDN